VNKQEAVKERPIPFSSPMVNAIHEGRKTQTRRAVKSVEDFTDVVKILDPSNDMRPFWRFSLSDGEATQCEDVDCPYGVVGDRLWVKEALYAGPASSGGGRAVAYYAADDLPVLDPGGCLVDWRWKRSTLPSIFMPRWASRFSTEIEDARVERLFDISETDAIAEGLDVETCASVFRKAVGRARREFGRWLEREDGSEPYTGENGYLCLDCIDKAARCHKAEKRGWNDHFETDSTPYCDECGVLLCHSLTEYGVESALAFTEDKENHWPYLPVSGSEALSLAELASGMGDLRDEHHGRLAQIAFATLWESLNGKGAWAANPFVWAITFRRIDA